MNRREFLSAASFAALPWPPVRMVRGDLPLKARPFPMTAVRLLDGPCKDAQEVNRKYLHRLPADRLLHNFRVTAGLPSAAQPLGGWEKPDGELRGHFTGHYLTACALMFSSTGDADLKKKADGMVAALAQCQEALKDGYLSAYPREFWDRLQNGKKVWAPFYTLHKIMAGLLDMHQHCGNQQALAVVENLAGWVDRWTEPLGEEHMQRVLDVEYGGMGEVLYNLWAATGKARYGEIAQRFDHQHFFGPLALRRDELKGLHVNTHIPQVIGAARRYELTREPRYRDIADFFWHEVTGSRCYVNGGTSNREQWLTDPRRLAAELRMATTTNECCKAYNLMRLTRRLYQWDADPRYFDYYERTLFNHRLGTIHPETGGTIYYLGLNPGSWKTFSTEFDSFWCCTGSGVEEYSKLNDSIYYHDERGFFVNLFIASEVNWAEKGVRLRQATRFPEEEGTSLTIQTGKPVQMDLRIRVPWWATRGGSVALNGKPLEAFAGPGSYLVISRVWKNGDRVDVRLPMHLYVETMPDDASVLAVLYGPLVLVGEMGIADPAKEKMFGPMGPTAKTHENPLPALPAEPVQPVPGKPLSFRAGIRTLTPFYRILNQRYTVYWKKA
ncbi:MAG: glycoside hydrolase family 127 protein [Acidobacteria bacterium]|nr:glycoside hydrolase family 127 protein [Acidobacteriota bacterium]